MLKLIKQISLCFMTERPVKVKMSILFFQKKSQKTPKDKIRIALKRFRLIKL